MPKLEKKPGGAIGFALLVIVVILAIRASRSTACCAESGTEGCHCSEAA